ncbi:MAG: heavy-metal-associated domain-containing protein [Lachnospiraceae bacterium]|nr:heavy-metal-associated domain-containing protein [Lachnospiraceae bacterium]
MGSILSTTIMVLILLIIIALAVRSSLKHLKGEGGCCGGGGELKAEKKKLEGKQVMRLQLTIEGMHCENCKNRIERAINDMDGAVAKVNLKKNSAVISMDREIAQEEFVKRIEDLDFQVKDVKEVPVV